MVTRAKVVFVLLGCLVLSGTAHATTEPQAQALAQVQAEAKRGNYQLISPETIKDRFVKEPGSLFLVDTRQEWEYQLEYIQDAVNLPVTPTWWTQYSPWVRGEMKKLLGSDKKRQVVFY
ncbi:MAG: rhodanese-like domain-containing protein [Proteobacteria bacterium]|nr:rhodanese-like domain-containing protein [Pseudomonadota bacterium]